MKLSIRKGFSFGLISGIITTLGLMVGLYSNAHSTSVILGGILVIAIADALSDALGMHISQEVEKSNSTKEIWESTFATLLAKFFIALTLAVPLLLLNLNTAVFVSVIWGVFLLIIFNYYLAKQRKEKPYKVISEHLLIAFFVILITYYIGDITGKFSVN